MSALAFGVSGLSAPAYALDEGALPSGGNVVGGSAALDYSIPDELHVYQSSDRAVIDWSSFNIGSNALTQFHQPGSSSMVVNRVFGGTDPTQILGTLKANGIVMVLDQNGVIFGTNSRVDVGGIIASTGTIDPDAFMAGGNITLSDIDSGTIINNGTITVADAGLAAFVAPTVINNGTITARLGRVQLAAGTTATLDLYGDGLFEIAVGKDTLTQTIINNGAIRAEGGVVHIKAASAKEAVDNLIVNTGIIAADSYGVDQSGKITLYAQGANKTDKNGGSAVINDGFITASGYGENETGGAIEVLGDYVALTGNSLMDASGDAGGGDIKIGGDYLGSGDTPTAVYTYVDREAYLFNDAITRGNGGRTIIWSDDTTTYHGSVYARGGLESGDGGFLETSGKINLLADGYADLTAANGNKGTYLLDPADITIYGNVDPTFVSTDGSIDLSANLALWLDAADASKVELTYSADALGGATVTGVSGSNTITTSTNVSGLLEVGARIRLGAGGTVTTADILGPDTYTITNIAGTTITVAETLTANYTGAALNRGLVSTWLDKATGSNATQTISSRRPLWISSSSDLNNQSSLRFFASNISQLLLTPDLNNAAGGYNTFLFTMKWNGASNQMPLGFTSYDLWFGNTNGFGFNTAGGNVYGIEESPLANTWVQSTARFYNGSIQNNVKLSINGLQQAMAFQQGGNGSATVTDTMKISGWNNNASYLFDGKESEIIAYNDQISATNQALLEQYQSAKWGMDLTPPGTGATEADRAMASDGYGVFTTRYLEKLSNTADIVLQADNSITLDLKGDTLTLAGDRSLTLTSTNGDITTASAGAITTTRTGSGGNITFNAGDGININHALLLTANNNGVITFNSAGNSNGLSNVSVGAGVRAGDLYIAPLPAVQLVPASVLNQSSNVTTTNQTAGNTDDVELERTEKNSSRQSISENSGCLASFAEGPCVLGY